ncbi:hypothetical protein COP2_019488 [Malus domestica]
MATESQQWAAEHSQKRGIFELSAGSPNMSVQMEKMEKKIDAKFDIILQQIANSTQQQQFALSAAWLHTTYWVVHIKNLTQSLWSNMLI